MINWVDIDFISVPENLLELKGVVGIRVCYDSDWEPFSYHAMRSKNEELGYVIPDMGSHIVEVNRTWSGNAVCASKWVELPPKNN